MRHPAVRPLRSQSVEGCPSSGNTSHAPVAVRQTTRDRRFSATGEPDPDDAALIRILINYRVQATNDRRNLVYPFYVIPREES